MNIRQLSILTIVSLALLLSFSSAYCADTDFSKLIFKDSPLVIKMNLSSLLSSSQMTESKIPALKKAQEEIQAEIEKRTGLVITRDIKELIFTVGPAIDFSVGKPNNFLVILTGSFNAEKLIAEMSKEKKIKFKSEKKNGRYHLTSDQNVQALFLNENVFIFGPDDAIESVAGGKFAGAELSGASKKHFDGSKFFLNLSLTPGIKDDILKNMKMGVPPIASILLKSLQNMIIFDDYPAMVIRTEFSEKTAAEDLKKLIGSFKDMADVIISAKEKEEDQKLSKAGAIELLNPELIGMRAAIGLGKTLLGSLEVTSGGGACEIKLKVPEEFQAAIKAEHMPVLVGVTGILAAIAVPNFTKARHEAQKKSCISNMKTIEGGCELYMMENDSVQSLTVEELLKYGYLKRAPVCASQKEDFSGYKITMFKDGGVEVECPFHGKLSQSY
jgi:competence protein ComGC